MAVAQFFAICKLINNKYRDNSLYPYSFEPNTARKVMCGFSWCKIIVKIYVFTGSSLLLGNIFKYENFVVKFFKKEQLDKRHSINCLHDFTISILNPRSFLVVVLPKLIDSCIKKPNHKLNLMSSNNI